MRPNSGTWKSTIIANGLAVDGNVVCTTTNVV
jgi:hypothetical protein